MANILALFKKYVALLDEVYKVSSLTAKLDSDSSLARQGANANEIIIPKLDMSGLGDYSRNDGYVNGDVTLTNQTVTFNYERGRMFTVDAMDNEETAFLAFGRLASEFIRTKVIPELDAFRFATYASTPGISKATPATLADGTAVINALKAAKSKMTNDEVPQEGRHLFITSTHYDNVIDLNTSASKEIWKSFASITIVPESRFYTAIDLRDGKSTGEETGGYTKAAGGKDINFLIIHIPALMQYTKHVAPKVITPEQNQNADAWKFGYRNYGLADVYDNKLAGIYLHNKA